MQTCCCGLSKKDGSFYVEDVDESTPMLDVTPISQLLVRGGDVYFKNNLSREYASPVLFIVYFII